MERKNPRRTFLKQLVSFTTFSAGSILTLKGNRSFRNLKYNLLRVGRSEAHAETRVSRVKKIAVEEHANNKDIESFDKRLKDMEEAGIDMQVISMAPGETGDVDVSREITIACNANETLSRIVEKYRGKFAGYTSLPLQDPDASARELERAVKNLGLKGPLIYAGHTGGYVDEKRYWGIYETAERLDVPVYIHPGKIMPDMSKPYTTYPILSYAMWGFAAATGLHAMRLILSGVFDKYPRLKIMLGHMGEGIPFWLWRIDKHWVSDRGIVEKDSPGLALKKQPSQYFKENFYVTTSGMYWEPAFTFVNSVLGADRILFAADYPPESALEASQFIDSVPLSEKDKEKVCHLNAENLLKL
jgi:5-carboxyvanillate decarboxylase